MMNGIVDEEWELRHVFVRAGRDTCFPIPPYYSMDHPPGFMESGPLR